MCRISHIAAVVLLVGGRAGADNSTTWGDAGACGGQPWEAGPWGALLEDWATSAPTHQSRHGRIMALPPAQGYYVSDRIDLMPPPPPPPHHHHPPPPPHGPHRAPPPHGMHHPPPPPPPPHGQYEEWQASPPTPPEAGKILNRPPNPYKDKFKPSYAPPSPNQPHPVHGPPPPPPGTGGGGGAADRLDAPAPPAPQKQVSETDLFLLSAIEKLVYRVDLMEKRLRKMEENVHYLVAGATTKPEPCAANFTRAGDGCYHFSTDALNWKNANYACRKLRASLLELEQRDERRALLAAVLADQRLRGADWWTGGLNPGLLWIWSHSARPVAANSTGGGAGSGEGSGPAATIAGDGRCLALVHDPTVNAYVYRGQDCSLRHRYVCEKEEDKNKLGNEIERVARKLRDGNTRKSKVLWTDDEPIHNVPQL